MKCKRILSLCLCSCLLLFSFAGCGSEKTDDSKSTASSAPPTSTVSTGSGTPADQPEEPVPAPQPETSQPETPPAEPPAETPEEPPQATLPQGDKYMAITFDDGPTGNEGGRTERLLDGLKARNVHATFFLCGYRVRDFNSMMDRYLAEGHEIGNHTTDHIRLDTKTDDGGYAQVSATNDLIASYTGQNPTLMRPTGGAYNDAVISSMKQLGLPIILWNIDTLDWKNRDAALVKQRIVENAADGAIVLEHDLYETTVEGVLAAIDELQAQGYAFVTVSELAQLKGVTLEPGKVYSGFTENDVVVESGANYS